MPLGRTLHPRPKALPRDSSHVDFNLPDKVKNTAWKVIMTLGGDADNQGKNWPLELGFECTLKEGTFFAEEDCASFLKVLAVGPFNDGNEY